MIHKKDPEIMAMPRKSLPISSNMLSDKVTMAAGMKIGGARSKSS